MLDAKQEKCFTEEVRFCAGAYHRDRETGWCS